MTNYNKSTICKTANTLRKRGYTMSQAFILAWAIAKGTTARVAGTDFYMTRKQIGDELSELKGDYRRLLKQQGDSAFSMCPSV